jgi:hypothetical protein
MVMTRIREDKARIYLSISGPFPVEYFLRARTGHPDSPSKK